MRWYQIEEEKCQSVAFTNKLKQDDNSGRKNGGIMKNGELVWIFYESCLEIIGLQHGQQICYYDFADCPYLDVSTIHGIYEVEAEQNLLAICLQNSNSDSTIDKSNEKNSILVVYSIVNNCILSYLYLNMQATCAHFLKKNIYDGTLLQEFNGCLAVGSNQGVVQLVNLQIQKTLLRMTAKLYNCHIHLLNMELSSNILDLQRRIHEDLNCAIQLQAIHNSSAISCISAIDEIKSLVVGTYDGCIALYNMQNLQYTHLLIPHMQQRMVPIIYFGSMLNNDYLHSRIYIWAIYKTNRALTAILHEFDFAVYGSETHKILLNELQKLDVCLELELDDTNCSLTTCQALSLTTARYNKNIFSPCIFGWCSENTRTSKLLVFDLNQWLKEKRPFYLHGKCDTKCLAGYILKQPTECIGMHIDKTSTFYFNSGQRNIEYFNPNCVSFSFRLLEKNRCHTYIWEGAQNKLIQILRASNASIFLETERYFDEVLQANLQPTLGDYNISSKKINSTLDTKYECLLSVLLENNCYNVLRDCVVYWSDGNFCSNNLGSSSGLSLSVIIKWMSERTNLLDTQCAHLYNYLLHKNCTSSEPAKINELGILIRQLKLLSNLTCEIINRRGKRESEVFKNSLTKKMENLNAKILYYRVGTWLFNMGLLNQQSQSKKIPIFNYNFTELQYFYKQRRSYFANLSIDQTQSRKTSSLLFIDNFVLQECGNCDKLFEQWHQDGANGLYPPASINVMLQMLLIPEFSYESKCTILLYFFLDLNLMIERNAIFKDKMDQFVNFPTVFNLRPSLTKTVQIFWCLDRGFLPPTLDEFISLIKQTQQKQWLLELLLQILLTQDAAYLALRVLQVCSANISNTIILRIHLANDMIPEAFQIARIDASNALLELFFSYCITAGKYGVIRNLALSKSEGVILQNTLKNSKAYCADNLQFIYLLSQSKFIEALAYMDELSQRTRTRNKKTETPHLVLSAFNTTMAPMTQGLTDTYFRIHSKIKQREIENFSPVPMSCQLIKQNANTLLGGIYHSSVLSANFATYYWNDIVNEKILVSHDVPFLGKPQLETYTTHNIKRGNGMTFPKVFHKCNKRSIDGDKAENLEAYEDNMALLQNSKKRRRCSAQNNIDFNYMGSNTVQAPAETFTLNVTNESLDTLNQSSLLEENRHENFQKNSLPKLNKSANHIPQKTASSFGLTAEMRICANDSEFDKSLIKCQATVASQKSNIEEFKPMVCSSKVYDLQSTLITENDPIQLTESTVAVSSDNLAADVSLQQCTWNENNITSDKPKQMLETTLDMSSLENADFVKKISRSGIHDFTLNEKSNNEDIPQNNELFGVENNSSHENDRSNLNFTIVDNATCTFVGEESDNSTCSKSMRDDNYVKTINEKPTHVEEAVSDIKKKSKYKSSSTNVAKISEDNIETTRQTRRSKRGISVPPQVVDLGKDTFQMSNAPRSYRATSLQPTSDLPEEILDTASCDISLESNIDSERDSVKLISGFDVQNIYSSFDSPSRNTRSRTRRKSEESDLYSLRSRINSVPELLQSSKTTSRRLRGKSEPVDDNSSNSSSSMYKTRSRDNLRKTGKLSSSMENVLTTTRTLKRRTTRHQPKVLKKSVSEVSDPENYEDEVESNILVLEPIEENEDDETSSVISIASSTRSQRRKKAK